MPFSRISEKAAEEMRAAARDPVFRTMLAPQVGETAEENLALLWTTLDIVTPVLDPREHERPLPEVPSFRL